jgi:pimeloyl-ACP methyl ester carboxylesterase
MSGSHVGRVASLLSVVLVLAGSDVMAQESFAPDRSFDSNGVRIRYIEQGQGAPIVLIHGYTGTLERHWVNSGVFTDLAKRYRVIALDCRGHGRSDKPTTADAYGVEMARDVVRLLDHLDIGRAHVVGFSMGAFIAGYLATNNADRLLSATFVAHHPLRKWTAADKTEAEASAIDLESETPFRRLILAVASPDAPPSEGDVRKLSQGLAAANSPSGLAAYHRGLHGLVVTDTAVAAIQLPVLGIIGSRDPSLEGMHELKMILPALSLAVVDGAEHGGDRGVLRHPAFLEKLRSFLSLKPEA